MQTLVFGSRDDMDTTQRRIGAALGVTFALHDSFFYGGDYFLAKSDNLRISVQRNFVEDDGDLTRPELPDHQVVVYLTQADDAPPVDAAALELEPSSA